MINPMTTAVMIPSHLHVRPPSIQRAFVRQFAISDYPVVITERWA